MPLPRTGHRRAMNAVAYFAIGAVIVIGAMLVAAAVLDRRRGKQIEHDTSRLDVDTTHDAAHDATREHRRRVRR